MPFIQRNREGIITGLFANSQPGYAEEYLEEDNVEIEDFYKKHGKPLEVKPRTEEELMALSAQLNAQWEAIDEEIQGMRNAILNHLQLWSEIETGLCSILHNSLRVERYPQIAMVIYFSSTSLGARITLVKDVIYYLISNSAPLAELKEPWEKIITRLEKIINTRNKVAHGSVMRINHGDKTYVRVVPPFFDIKRHGANDDGSPKGLSLRDLQSANKALIAQIALQDDIDKILEAFSAGALDEIQKYLSNINLKLKN